MIVLPVEVDLEEVEASVTVWASSDALSNLSGEAAGVEHVRAVLQLHHPVSRPELLFADGAANTARGEASVKVEWHPGEGEQELKAESWTGSRVDSKSEERLSEKKDVDEREGCLDKP